MEPRAINARERKLLDNFADGELSLPELLEELEKMVRLEFSPTERRLTSHLLPAEPGISLTRERIDAAYHHITSTQPQSPRAGVEWATMLLLNDAYTWDADTPDGEYVSNTLHRLSMPTIG